VVVVVKRDINRLIVVSVEEGEEGAELGPPTLPIGLQASTPITAILQQLPLLLPRRYSSSTFTVTNRLLRIHRRK